MRELISVEDARFIILDAVARGPVETVRLQDAQGRTLAESVHSKRDLPPFDNSAVDGYAVRAKDLTDAPASLRVVGKGQAGAEPTYEITPGTCAEIMTGAPLPAGADAVAPVEWTEPVDEDQVRIRRALVPGRYVRSAGKDIRAGDQAVEAGTAVTPPVVGMLAMVGAAKVPVHAVPSVAVIATGDELVEVDETPGPGQIRNANAPALAAQVRSAGGCVHGVYLARDDKADVRRVIEAAREADVLVFSGGVSVGVYDYVKQVLDAMGMELLFWKVRQRPGKPLAFGLLDGTPVFGLPGNPVSSAMCFEQHVRPALAKMLGRKALLRPRHPAVLSADTPKVEGLHYFARGVAEFGKGRKLYVRDTGPQASNLYSSVVKANCIIHLPAGLRDPAPGTEVEIEWLHWARGT